MAYLEDIQAHYVTQNQATGAFAKIVADIIRQVVEKMEEMDMPEQEIISILLPITHPLNGPATKDEDVSHCGQASDNWWPEGDALEAALNKR